MEDGMSTGPGSADASGIPDRDVIANSFGSQGRIEPLFWPGSVSIECINELINDLYSRNKFAREEAQRIQAAVNSQLLARPANALDIWGGNPRTRSCAAFVSWEISVCMGWENAIFIPEDPRHVLFWDSLGARMNEVAEMSIRHEFHVPNSEVKNFMKKNPDGWTLGDMVSFLVEISNWSPRGVPEEILPLSFDPSKSFWDRFPFFRRLPFVGRQARMYRSTSHQMGARRAADLDAWGRGARERTYATVVANLIPKYTGWLHILFLPQDSCRFVFGDISRLRCLLEAAAGKLGVPKQRALDMVGELWKGTLGQLVARLLEQS